MIATGARSGTQATRRVFALGVAVVLATLTFPTYAAGIVRWVDKAGVVHYSNVPGDARPVTATPATAASATPAPSGATSAAIYKYRDATGITHYTDRKPRHQNYVVISVFCPACDPKSPVDWTRTRLNTTAYAAEISAAALANGVDPALVRALIHAESAFNKDARSRKGAQGLMQLMPSVASDYGVSDPFDAGQNIRAGVKHLSNLIKQYRGDLRLVFAAYNAGPGAVKKYGGVPPYEETQVYVDRVGTLHRRYGVELAGVTPMAPMVAPVTAPTGAAQASALNAPLPR